MGNPYKRPANMASPVDWAHAAAGLAAELETVKRERDNWRDIAESYQEAARELYLWTKEPHDRLKG